MNISPKNHAPVTVSDTATVDLTITPAQELTAAVITDSVTNSFLANMTQGTIKGRAAGAGTGDPTDLTGAQVATIVNASLDHGTLLGLSDDDHAQYALLAGRSGGQTVIGGTLSGDDLIFKATSHATSGDVAFQYDSTDIARLTSSRVTFSVPVTITANSATAFVVDGGAAGTLATFNTISNIVTFTVGVSDGFRVNGIGGTGDYILCTESPLPRIKLGSRFSGGGKIDVEGNTITDIGNLEFTSVTGLVADVENQNLVDKTAVESISGVWTFTADPIIPDEVYGAPWNGSFEPPTKNAVFDKIESLSLGGVTSVTAGNTTLTISPTTGAVVASLNLSNANVWLADQSVPAEVYGAGWNGSNEVPTKNDVFDKIESLTTGVSSVTANANATLTISPTTGAVIAGINLANANVWTGAQTVDAAFNVGTSGGTGHLATFHTATAGIDLSWNGAAASSAAYLVQDITPSRTAYWSITGTDTAPVTMSQGILAITPTFTTGTTGTGANLLYFLLTDTRSIAGVVGQTNRIFRGEVSKSGTKTGTAADVIEMISLRINSDSTSFNAAGGINSRSGVRVGFAMNPTFNNATPQTLNITFFEAGASETFLVFNTTGTNNSTVVGLNVQYVYVESITAGAVTAAHYGVYYRPGMSSVPDTEAALRADRSGILLASDDTGSGFAGGYVLFGGGQDVRIGYTGTVWDFDVKLATTEIVFNNSGFDTDFRIESDTDVDCFFVDAGNNRVGISTNAPAELFDVDGLSRCQTLTIDGDVGSGVASTIRHTNVNTAVSGVTPATLGFTGGGPATAAQSHWLKFYDGTTIRYIPVWT